MLTIKYVLLVLYLLILVFQAIYCLSSLQLLDIYKKYRKSQKKDFPKYQLIDRLPLVTIQLPIYNEFSVVGQLLEGIEQLNYPKERLEIQVIDDSNDDTSKVIADKVASLNAKGLKIHHIKRLDREGFKAGALQYGMRYAQGKFIAIFDADFIPDSDFLLATLPYFENEQVGLVQTHLDFVNKNYSLLTRLQAFQLNLDFAVELPCRNFSNSFLQFNGTGGIWRREAIETSGGWQGDTLAEDLDLSLRSQLTGWKIIFMDEITSTGQLPIEFNSLRSQQFRWAKGKTEVARKLLPQVWKSEISLEQKIDASLFCLPYIVYVFLFLSGILSFNLSFIEQQVSSMYTWLIYIFYLSCIIPTFIVYYLGNIYIKQKENVGDRILNYVWLYACYVIYSISLSRTNTVAVFQGITQKKTTFMRTPKFDLTNLDSLSSNQTEVSNNNLTCFTKLIEFLLGHAFLSITIFDVMNHSNFLLIHSIYCISFLRGMALK